MNELQFWYSVHDSTPFPGDFNVRRKHGTIQVVSTECEPYEIMVNVYGKCFHAIFGSQINGHFLCIPNYNIGCSLGPYEDLYWNIESIYDSHRVSYEDACAIGNALQLMKIFLGKTI